MTPTGALGTGWLTARLPALDVPIQEEDPANPGSSDYPRSRGFGAFPTDGRLSPSLAAYLSASRHVEWMMLSWWLENIQGIPPDEDREVLHIVPSTLDLDVALRPVPEPSVMALSAVAFGGAVAWRRRRTRLIP